MTSVLDEMRDLMEQKTSTGSDEAPVKAGPQVPDFKKRDKPTADKEHMLYSAFIKQVKATTKWKEKLYDPKKHGPDFLIPINAGAVDEKWQRYIPTLEEVKDLLPNPHRLYELTRAYADNKTVRLVGPPGVGKTNGELKLIHHVLCLPMYVLRFNGDLDRGYLVGEKELENDDGTPTTKFVPTESTEFLLGCSSGTFVMDEVMKTNAGTLMVYQSLVEPTQDGAKPRTLTVHGMANPIQEVNKGLRIVATDNTKGLGDGLAKYAAANVADVSFLSRFDAVIEFDYLDSEHQTKLAKRWADKRMSDDMIKKLVQFGRKMEDAYSNNKVGLSWSLRNLWEVVDLSIKFEDPVKAIAVNYFRGLAKKDEREFVDKIRQTVFGDNYGALNK